MCTYNHVDDDDDYDYYDDDNDYHRNHSQAILINL